MACQACLENSLRDAQRTVAKLRSTVLLLKGVLKDVREHLPPDQQQKVDEALKL